MPVTSPSVAAHFFTEPEIPFQANTGKLWIYRNGHGTNTGLGMAPHTSPSIRDGAFGPMLAFQANTGKLWVSRFGSAFSDTGLGMKPGTSPSINGLGFVAFQGNTGTLWIYRPSGTRNLGAPMMAGTSPSYAGVIAYQGSNGHLWVYRPNIGTDTDTGLRMRPGTSPSEERGTVAFQGINEDLWIYHQGVVGTDIGLGMMVGTSPSIAVTAF
jgi:hypothetical protein